MLNFVNEFQIKMKIVKTYYSIKAIAYLQIKYQIIDW